MEVVSADAVIGLARESLGLAAGSSDLDEPYLAAALRRLSGFLCPCSPRTLHRAMIESHRGIGGDEGVFGERVDAVIETLAAIGDLLEVGDVAIEGDGVKGTWLVAAPPAFVARESGNVFILGLSADEQTPLPTEMRTRVVLDRAIRSIQQLPDEDLPSVLREFGLRELSMAGWLRSPKAAKASDLLGTYDARLAAGQRSGEIPDLLVLDGGRNTRSYRRRWTQPGSLTGNFVVRRPQTFGADLWGYAQLADGKPLKILDLPGQGERWRGCDVAWRIQMAIDQRAGRPQEYRLVRLDDGSRFDFFSPIPNWSRRHLAVIGQEVKSADCLMSFVVPAREVATEEKFLNQLLYLSKVSE